MGLAGQGLVGDRRGIGQEGRPLSFDLQRFDHAQQGVYERTLAELRDGHKRSHWIWFIFPQVAGLGHSAMAQRYAVTSLDEARAYLAHDVLGPRLRECTQAVLDAEGHSAHAIFGAPDDLKFRSSMTLFDLAEPDGIFHAALEKYFDGKSDPLTLEKIR
ncbi:MAG TPA: DUF1810 domain-containing protein [Rhizomicrobium sp.]|nr:DUF1810 domain-containing protein [Rhizomicrobium sp.]